MTSLLTVKLTVDKKFTESLLDSRPIGKMSQDLHGSNCSLNLFS